MASLMTISPIDLKLLTYYFSGVMLKCGLHKCSSSCHQLFDHSKVLCKTILTQKCSSGHHQSWKCHSGAPLACNTCERDRKEAVKKAQRDLEEKLKRDEKIQRHLKEMAQIDEEIERITQSIKHKRLDSEQQTILNQKRIDLAAVKKRANETQTSFRQEQNIDYDNEQKQSDLPTTKSSEAPPKQSLPVPKQHLQLRKHIKAAVEHNESPSQKEWQRQKDQENAHNPVIDKIMEMIGLEDVKAQVLRIKAKVETSIRQGTDLSKERLGLVLLGNPGTGTVLPLIVSLKLYTSLTILRQNHGG